MTDKKYERTISQKEDPNPFQIPDPSTYNDSSSTTSDYSEKITEDYVIVHNEK
ncbi:MAG: hypothetical protein ACM3SY_15755 [Candidatus Omnitrophota bacterium]